MLVYAGLNIYKGILQEQERENAIKSQKYVSKEYKQEDQLSVENKFWVDDWFGGTAFTSLIGNPEGIYAPVMVQTDEYTYKGEVILAPAGPFKTNSKEAWCDIVNMLTMPPYVSGIYYPAAERNPNPFAPEKVEYVDTDLDYSLQARNYMRYSDLYCEDGVRDNDGKMEYDDRVGTWLRRQDPENKGEEVGWDSNERYGRFTQAITYSQNNWAFFEDALYSKTVEKGDEVHNAIIPYIYDYYPLITFSPEETFIEIPEFYEGESLYIPDAKYEGNTLIEEENIETREIHDHIFKVWAPSRSTFTGGSTDNEIRVVPKNSVHSINPRAIDNIEVHLVSYHDSSLYNDDDSLWIDNYRDRQITVLDDNDYSFVDGKIVLNKDIYLRLQEEWLDRTQKEFWDEENNNYDFGSPHAAYKCYILFEIKLDKYQPIEGDKDKSRIALMQSIHASVLEYFYQSQLATHTQSKLNELAYTVAITVLTSICSGGLSTVYKEVFEEMFLDPALESVVEGIVRSWGGNRYAQLIASCIAESGREGATGDIKNRNNKDIDTKTDSEVDIDTQYNNAKKKSKLSTAISTILIFAAYFTGIGAPIALTFGTMSILSGIQTHMMLRANYKKAKEAQLSAIITGSMLSIAEVGLSRSDTYDAGMATLVELFQKDAKDKIINIMPEQEDNIIKKEINGIGKMISLFGANIKEAVWAQTPGLKEFYSSMIGRLGPGLPPLDVGPAYRNEDYWNEISNADF